jgi:hypothetical protein
MKLLRIPASLAALVFVSVLAACGGGGGGGSTNPPVTNPGGGGGGATPTPGATATPTPAQSSTPAPTPTPTSSPGTIAASSSLVHAFDSTNNGPIINGHDNWQTNGVTSSDPGDGDTATGGSAANNFQTFDGVSCAIGHEPASTPPTYHVHSFLGIMVNGTEMAVPDGLGMDAPDNNEPILTFSCAYNIHTHGASGVIHVEDPSISGNWDTNPAVQPPAKYNVQTLLDIWGQSATGLAGGTGLPTVYIGTPNAKTSTGADLVTQYSVSTAPLNTILLQHHVAIWFVYGGPNPPSLPQVEFDISD